MSLQYDTPSDISQASAHCSRQLASDFSTLLAP
jgi:hypothetical protein